MRCTKTIKKDAVNNLPVLHAIPCRVFHAQGLAAPETIFNDFSRILLKIEEPSGRETGGKTGQNLASQTRDMGTKTSQMERGDNEENLHGGYLFLQVSVFSLRFQASDFSQKPLLGRLMDLCGGEEISTW